MKSLNTNERTLFIRQKAEKLTSVLYILSDFFDDRDPLKWRLRVLGVSLIKDTERLSRAAVFGDQQIQQSVVVCVDEINRILKLSKMVDYVSEMNYELLEGELVSFRNFVKNGIAGVLLGTEQEKENLLGRDLGEIDFAEGLGKRKELYIKKRIQPEKALAHSEGLPSTQSKQPRAASHKGQVIKDMVSNREAGGVLGSETGGFSVALSERQKGILTTLKKGERYSIKDILMHVSGVSEKTVQRDLLSLVNKGYLSKAGERRWSSYALS